MKEKKRPSRGDGCLIETMCQGDFAPVISPPTPACEMCTASSCDYYRFN